MTPSADGNLYERLVQAVVDYAIFMLDPDGIVTNWNTGAERAKGYAAEDIVGQHFSVFYTPEDKAAGIPARALAAAAQEGRFEAEGWRVRKDGSRFFASVIIDAIRGESGELLGFAKITRDITERMEAQKRLDETREQLFQAQKLEALGQLTGGLAHDFNNLLTAVISGAELASRQTDLGKIQRFLDSILASAQRGSNLTRQLLAFARRQPLEPKSIDLQDHLPTTTALLRHSLNPSIELVSEISDQVWAVQADPTQLELAILNLGFNARDAMPDGGSLRISARNVTLDGDVEGLVGDHVAISVADTGAGIQPEIQSRIFEPFFTTKGYGEGTGLGLSQVFGFVKQSGGSVTVDSTVGEGTTITLYLPVSRAGAKASASGGAAARILVVEDDLAVAELAAALLEEMGHEAHVVHSAGEALQELNREAPDLVFSDIVMPGGADGVELARAIRRRFPELPILLTTGYSQSLATENQEFPVVLKPYAFQALSDALATLLRRNSPETQMSLGL